MRGKETMSATSTNGAVAAKNSGSFSLIKVLLEGRAFFALIAIILAFSSMSPNYASVGNFLIMANHVAIFGLLAIGMLLVILNGGIDLSVGSVLGLSGVFAGWLMQGVEIEFFLKVLISQGVNAELCTAWIQNTQYNFFPKQRRECVYSKVDRFGLGDSHLDSTILGYSSLRDIHLRHHF